MNPAAHHRHRMVQLTALLAAPPWNARCPQIYREIRGENAGVLLYTLPGMFASAPICFTQLLMIMSARLF